MKNVFQLPIIVGDQDALIDHFYTLELVPFARPANSAQIKYTAHIPSEILDMLPNKDYITYQDIYNLGHDPFSDKFLVDYFGLESCPVDDEPNVSSGVLRTIHNEDITHTAIEKLKAQVSEIVPEANIDEVVYIFNEKGSHTRTHVDYPIRQNCVFIFPLYGENKYNFSATNATTFYKTANEEFKITTPSVLNVMRPHGVKNCDGERLVIQFEIDNLTYEQVYNILHKRYPEFYNKLST